jgi:hypothetical protein
MTTMTSPHTNGRKRPSLNEQINRLDSVLDGLSENLNDAVADAIKAAVGTAVKEAVQTVLKEVFTNPALLAKFSVPSAPLGEPIIAPARTMSPTPGLGKRLADGWQQTRTWISSFIESCRQPVQNLRNSARDLWRRGVERVTAFCAYGVLLRPFRNQILMALAIGMLMAILVCYASPWMAAVVSGIGGFITALTVQAGLWLRQLLKSDAEELV